MKKKPIDHMERKKKNFENTKQFVHKLENEENSKRNFRNTMIDYEREGSYSRSPKNKRYRQEKEQCISLISEVGDMETILTNCNVEKKKILAEMDKIDETKVKTREMT